MSIEALILSMIGISATLAMVSYRYHLAAVTYGPFVKEQVFASTNFRGLLEKTFGRPINLDSDTIEKQGTPFYPRYGYPPPSLQYQSKEIRATKEPRLDNLIQVPLRSPQLAVVPRKKSSTYSDATPTEPKISVFGSDYFAVWHHDREWLRGRNPYRNPDPIFYISHQTGANANGFRVIVDKEVPDQPVTNLRYFPLTLVVGLPFYLTNYFASFLLYLAVFHIVLFSLSGLLIWLSRGYRFQTTILMIVLYLASYPIGFMVDRGNIEGAVFIWVAAGLILYNNGSLYPAAICLGIAAGTKLTPALFFVLFLLDGRIKPLFVAVIVMIGSTVLAMTFMHDPLLTVFQQMRHNISDPSAENQPLAMTTRFNHSLLNFVRTIPPLIFNVDEARRWTFRLHRYWPVFVILSTFMILPRLRRLSFSNRAFVLACMMLAFPYASYDYRLILLYIPLGFVFHEIVREGRAPWPEAAICLFTMLLFAPKAYELSGRGIDFAVNGLTLVVLIILGLIPSPRLRPMTENPLVA